MGFRNPFRIQVDENDVAYVTDYSPDSSVPEQFRGPAGTGRMEIVRKPANYGWPLCYTPEPAVLPLGLQHLDAARRDPDAYECGNPAQGPQNTSRWNTTAARPSSRASRRPPITQPDIWYSYRDNTIARRSARRASAYYTRLRADRRARGSSRSCSPAAWARTARRSTTSTRPTRARRSSRRTTTTRFPRRVHAVTTLREVRLDSQRQGLQDQQLLNCGAVGSATQPFECDNPMDMQFGRRRSVLPADVRRRLLRRQPGRGHVQVGVREGPAGAAAPC